MFSLAKNHCDIAGACSYVIGIILWIAAAMVFGWSISAAAWEAYRHAIMALAESYFDNVELVAKYQNYLDVLEWDEPSDEVVNFVQANRDEFNQGVLDKEGRHKVENFVAWLVPLEQIQVILVLHNKLDVVEISLS